MQKLLLLFKLLIGWPLSLVAFFFIGRLLFIQKINWTIFLHINWYLLAISVFCFLVYFFLRVSFWQQLLRLKNIRYSFKQTATIWGISELRRYIPGNIWSFLSRTSFYTKDKHIAKVILQSLLSEIIFLIIGCLAVSLMCVNFLIFSFVHFPLQKFAPYAVVGVIGAIILVFCLQHLFLKKNPLAKLRLLLMMSTAFFFLGLGTYFSLLSFLYLTPIHILSLVGFFVFSFLIGYLSFITPMGLGVREGVMTVGLTKFTSLTNAALGSIFSRIVLIFAEILFIVLSIAWEKVQNKTAKIEKFVLSHKQEILLGFFILVYCLYFTAASFLRYNNFFTGRFDLGNMDQTVWNTMRGHFFQLTNPDGTNIISRLAFHADYMLALLAPLYYIWQDPKMLLLVQTIVLSLGSVFVYLISQKLFNNKYISLVFAILFLINPSVNNTNLYDFHSATLATTLLLGAWYLCQKNKYLWSTVFLLLAGTTKEELWLTIAFFGVYFFLFKKKRVLGTLLAMFSLYIFYFLLWKAIPSAHGGTHFALGYYSAFGTSQQQVVRTILFSPWKVITTVFSDGSLQFLLQIFSPLSFMALLSPFALLFATGDFAIDLLSSNAQLHNIGFQYTATLTPFIFLSSMYGFLFLTKKVKQIPSQYLATGILLIGILCAYLFGPLPGARSFNHDMFTKQLPYAHDVDNFLNTIPHKYSIAASNNVGSHLSHRDLIYTIPNGVNQADIIVMLLNDKYAQPSLSAQKQLAQSLRTNPLYVELFNKGDFVVFKKKSVPTYVKKHSTALFPLFKGN